MPQGLALLADGFPNKDDIRCNNFFRGTALDLTGAGVSERTHKNAAQSCGGYDLCKHSLIPTVALR